MRLFTALTVAAGIGLAVSATPASAGNIVPNGGFESGTLGPWSQINDQENGGVNWTVTNTQSHSGSFSATDTGNKEVGVSVIPTAVSSITSASFWVLQPAAALDAVDLFYSDNTSSEFVIFDNGTWQNVDLMSQFQAGKTLTGFGFWGAGPGVTTFLDDVDIEAGGRSAVPEPSPVAAFAVGILGLGALSIFARRRRSAN